MIRGLIFDFDGLILDTEWPIYQSWVELFAAFGAELPFSQWAEIIGTSAHEHFDPYTMLETRIGRPIDRRVIRPQRRVREMELILAQPILPGVQACLDSARARGLRLGVASSSDRAWVEGHLTRLGLRDSFEVIHTCEDVAHTKPDPALYLLTLHDLGLQAHEAIVLEDSPNGVLAAKRAGIFAVAIPNRLTAMLNLDHADLRLNSLTEVPLADLLRVAADHWGQHAP